MSLANVNATDFSHYATLRSAAQNDDPAALREVARQFESMFLQTLMKNMRAAELAEPLLGSNQHDMYRDLTDQQLAQEMAQGRGIGFADMLVRQLGGGAAPISRPQAIERFAVQGSASNDTPSASDWSTPRAFAAELWPHVKRAAERLNVAPEAVLAHAALETGWGRHVMHGADGSNSYNLFGIKANADWHGGSVVRKTLEFEDGLPGVVKARFRAYPDLAATFADYAQFLSGNPRYAEVLGQGSDVAGFAVALKNAGYATDPLYATKLEAIAAGDTLRDAVAPLKSLPRQPILPTDTTDPARSIADERLSRPVAAR